MNEPCYMRTKLATASKFMTKVDNKYILVNLAEKSAIP